MKIQALVYRYYQPGQCELNPAPSLRWHAAADMAIAQVAIKEGLISDDALGKVMAKSKAIIFGASQPKANTSTPSVRR